MNQSTDHISRTDAERPWFKRVNRRSFLRRSTALTALPLVTTLTIQEARAQGSGGS